MLVTQSFRKFLITVTLFASKMEIAMDSLYVVAQLLQYKKQTDAVGAAAEGH